MTLDPTVSQYSLDTLRGIRNALKNNPDAYCKGSDEAKRLVVITREINRREKATK